MALESLAMLPEIQKLPVDETVLDLDFESQLTRIAGMDRDHFSIEFATAVEAPLTTLFDARNVDDVVREAYRRAYSNSDKNLQDHYAEMLERGEQSVTRFINPLKGKVAELRAPSVLEQHFPERQWSLASDSTQPVWDIRGIGPEGTPDLLAQVKVGSASYTPKVLGHMEETPNMMFPVGSEMYDRILEIAPERSGQLVDLGFSNRELTEQVTNDVELLARNFGIDVPDSLGEMLPYVGEVVLGIKLILDMVSVERDFKEIDLNDRSRVHAMKALVLLSRFGITGVCTSLGGAAGSIVLPGIGTAAGAIGGGGLAFFLSRRLRPRTLEVAMRIVNVTEDDLFYLQNKKAVDGIGESLASTLAA